MIDDRPVPVREPQQDPPQGEARGKAQEVRVTTETPPLPAGPVDASRLTEEEKAHQERERPRLREQEEAARRKPARIEKAR